MFKLKTFFSNLPVLFNFTEVGQVDRPIDDASDREEQVEGGHNVAASLEVHVGDGKAGNNRKTQLISILLKLKFHWLGALPL